MRHYLDAISEADLFELTADDYEPPNDADDDGSGQTHDGPRVNAAAPTRPRAQEARRHAGDEFTPGHVR